MFHWSDENNQCTQISGSAACLLSAIPLPSIGRDRISIQDHSYYWTHTMTIWHCLYICNIICLVDEYHMVSCTIQCEWSEILNDVLWNVIEEGKVQLTFQLTSCQTHISSGFKAKPPHMWIHSGGRLCDESTLPAYWPICPKQLQVKASDWLPSCDCCASKSQQLCDVKDVPLAGHYISKLFSQIAHKSF